MTDIRGIILAASSQNSHLLQILAGTDHASSAVRQNSDYIVSLKVEIAQRNKTIKGLTNAVDKERAEHQKYRDSTMRRLAYKFGGKKEKFDGRAEKEEREYLEAVQNHFNATRQIELLGSSLKEALAAHSELETTLQIHEDAQKALDQLYNSIFDGPTPDFPEEDAIEGPLHDAEHDFNEVQFRYSNECQARDILLDAQKCLKTALGQIYKANNMSTMDVIGFGGPFADMAERNALSQVKYLVSEYEMLTTRARQIQPSVRLFEAIHVASGMMGDVIFDNIYSDIDFHSRIRATQGALVRSDQQLTAELAAVASREVAIKAKLDQAKLVLDNRREELQKLRATLFESIAGGLPEYRDENSFSEQKTTSWPMFKT